MHGGSVWTADHTCRRREAVDKSGEQQEGRPNRPAMDTGSKRSRAQPKRLRGRNGEGRNGSKGEIEEKRATPCTPCCTYQQQPQHQQQPRPRQQQGRQLQSQQRVCNEWRADSSRRKNDHRCPQPERTRRDSGEISLRRPGMGMLWWTSS